MTKQIKSCRICGNSDLLPILDLGVQYLSGIFPASRVQPVPQEPLKLVKCNDHKNNRCGLLQLEHTVDLEKMYGMNYGYRSGLNQSMVRHLQKKVDKIVAAFPLQKDDLVIDIGSNDSTLLRAYPQVGARLIGVDPSAIKFKEFYPPHVELIPNFFTRDTLSKTIGTTAKAKIITSIAMFYDLEAPMDFVRDIYESLDDQGIWVFEQSYMPTMLEKNSYDTVCHEHLEYYSLKQIHWMMKEVGFKILDIEFNDINGGSFSVMVAKETSKHVEAAVEVASILQKEAALELDTLRPYEDFKNRIQEHKVNFLNFLNQAKSKGQRVDAYGASTKGNVILQYCGVTPALIEAVAEVNENKFGCYTPGTLLPIISEAASKEQKPDFFVVLPWHFKDFIVEKEKTYLKSGGCLVFPLPQLELVKG